MSSVWPRILLALLSLMPISYKSVGQSPSWCIANDNYPVQSLQTALNWSCGTTGVDCTMIQVNQPCYYPNTLKDHASWAINKYYQNHKHQGSVCKGVGVITNVDPSYDNCKFEYLP